MTEDEAREWLKHEFDVSRETWERLERYVAILLEEMEHQNLIAASTRDHVWARHIVDSAQLLKLAPDLSAGDRWADLGAGAGLPGMVVAILSPCQVTMIEMRRKRVEFLEQVIAALGLTNASVFGGKVERSAGAITTPVSVISARAYAPMDRLIASALPLARKDTVWILPKGQNYQNELDMVRTLWHSEVRVEPSLTAPDSAILVLKNVRKRGDRA
ncbi:MAG: 16S rRNA (guanine(527)-N(7))-methyltransferase RsmG [Sphingomonadales bacterium]|nr:MAG: 16S rRNA (guanine(527)-N(7))-methyltransferase RsmG [Sphingomonadales bacterium]TNF02317.1 MAG: 16S rRNA (guanine(527)-N(7))-methyltransferase RsmG [Sphingomonadales bacterium]